MGVSASSMTFDSGNGFFVDGGGKFLIGSASGHRMQFDGTDLILSSSKFFLETEVNLSLVVQVVF